jgi:mRNA-degrading endonuclease toxin of MazEF toxin-antitoxin module
MALWRPERRLFSTSPTPVPPLLVPVNCAGRDVLAVTDQIPAVAKKRLQERTADISPADLAAVAAGVRRILELG